MLLAFAPASISMRPASSATMAIGSSGGASPVSSGIKLSMVSIVYPTHQGQAGHFTINRTCLNQFCFG
jgi:hypothetical protein